MLRSYTVIPSAGPIMPLHHTNIDLSFLGYMLFITRFIPDLVTPQAGEARHPYACFPRAQRSGQRVVLRSFLNYPEALSFPFWEPWKGDSGMEPPRI